MRLIIKSLLFNFIICCAPVIQAMTPIRRAPQLATATLRSAAAARLTSPIRTSRIPQVPVRQFSSYRGSQGGYRDGYQEYQGSSFKQASIAPFLGFAALYSAYDRLKSALGFMPAFTVENVEKYPGHKDQFVEYALAHLDTVDPLAIRALVEKNPELKDPITQARINALNANRLKKKERFLDKVPDKPLAKLYEMRFFVYFYKPQEELFDARHNLIDVEKTFADNRVFAHAYDKFGSGESESSETWTKQEWSQVKNGLIRNQPEREHELHVKLPLDQAPELLQNAKSILKSFVPDARFDPEDKEFINENFINKKGSINRLFTYAKLQRVIEEKKLSHVHLPLKILLIKDKKTGKYITGDKALAVIDNLTKFFIHSPAILDGEIVLDNHDYYFEILAREQDRSGCGSQETLEDLKSLIAEAPFDIGFDNIFFKDGDAIIIDTEFKGEGSDTCTEKLVARYRFVKKVEKIESEKN